MAADPSSEPEFSITPPFGYGEIVPLQRSDRILVPHGATPSFCRSVNALGIMAEEMNAASRDYPLVFVSEDDGKSFAPAAVLGLAQDRNLFVDAAGDWDPQCYRPALVRRYPFCISKLYVNGVARGERVVCVAKDYVDAQGIALFDAEGRPGAYWLQMEQLLEALERALDATAAMCAALARLDLLAPFTFTLVDAAHAPQLELRGMHRIDENRFAALKPASLKALQRKGFLAAIYAHLRSLDNFARLYDRAVAMQKSRER